MNEDFYTINFSNLFKIITKNYLYFVGAGALALGYVFFQNQSKPDVYFAQVKIMPEVNHKSSNGLAGLFEAAKSISSGKDLYNLEITSVSLYSDILYSDDFYDFLQSKSPNLINNKSLLSKQILIKSQKQKATILETLAATPEKALLINQHALHFLLEYIKNYRTQKAKDDLEFIQNLKIEDISLKEKLITQQQIIVQDHTPVFKVLNQNQVSLLPTKNHFIYLAAFLISQFLVFVVSLIFNKNYLKILQKA